MGILGTRSLPTSDGTVRPAVLLVDDDPTTRAVMVGLIRHLGYVADAVGNGKGAVDAIRGGGYGILLLDIHMPGIDGFETARQVRALGEAVKQPRIVALTGQRESGTREKCLAAGMDDYLLKPVAQEALERALDRARGTAGSGA